MWAIRYGPYNMGHTMWTIWYGPYDADHTILTIPMDYIIWTYTSLSADRPYDKILSHRIWFFDLQLELGSMLSTVVSFICMYRGVQVYLQFRPSPFKLHRYWKTASELWYSRINNFINEYVPVLNPANIWNSNFESAHVHSWSEHL